MVNCSTQFGGHLNGSSSFVNSNGSDHMKLERHDSLIESIGLMMAAKSSQATYINGHHFLKDERTDRIPSNKTLTTELHHKNNESRKISYDANSYDSPTSSHRQPNNNNDESDLPTTIGKQ